MFSHSQVQTKTAPNKNHRRRATKRLHMPTTTISPTSTLSPKIKIINGHRHFPIYSDDDMMCAMSGSDEDPEIF